MCLKYSSKTLQVTLKYSKNKDVANPKLPL